MAREPRCAARRTTSPLRWAHRTTHTTPHPTAPLLTSRFQVIRREPHGAAVDLWSLGCLLYALLAGSPPFESWDISETLARAKAADYDTPAHLSPHARSLVAGLLQLVRKRAFAHAARAGGLPSAHTSLPAHPSRTRLAAQP